MATTITCDLCGTILPTNEYQRHRATMQLRSVLGANNGTTDNLHTVCNYDLCLDCMDKLKLSFHVFSSNIRHAVVKMTPRKPMHMASEVLDVLNAEGMVTRLLAHFESGGMPIIIGANGLHEVIVEPVPEPLGTRTARAIRITNKEP